MQKTHNSISIVVASLAGVPQASNASGHWSLVIGHWQELSPPAPPE